LEDVAGRDLVDVFPRAVLDLSASGSDLSFHLKAVRVIKQSTDIGMLTKLHAGELLYNIFYQNVSHRVCNTL